MAISVDRVYQKVLALANKEQRGYITPQEYNYFADHAQMDIFEQYFYDLDQRKRTISGSSSYADISSNIEEKISKFELYDQVISGFGSYGGVNLTSSFPDLYRLSMVRVSYQNYEGFCISQPVQLHDLAKYSKSPLIKNSAKQLGNSYYIDYSNANNDKILKVYPHPEDGDRVLVSYIKKPTTPHWTYVVSGSNALFNPSSTSMNHFSLHESEENNLVIKILQLAGISIKDYSLVQAANQEEIKQIQQEKQ